MDFETSEAIESVRGDLARVEATLTAEIGKLRLEMVTRADLAATREELRRHTDVRFESLRDDIRMLAEGYESLNVKVDENVARVDAKFERIDARFDRVDARFDRVDARFDRLDAKFEAKFDTLNAKIDRLLPPPV